MQDFQNVTYKERLKEVKLTILEWWRERGKLITIYKLLNNIEKTDRKYLKLRAKGEVGYLKGNNKKIAKGKLLQWQKK